MYICLNVYRCLRFPPRHSRQANGEALLKMSRLGLRQVHWHKKHEQHSRDACRQAVHANGRGQAAPTTSPARPSALVRTNAHGCQKGTSMRFYAARMSNHANKCGQEQGVRRHREGVRDGVRRRREGRRQQLRLRIRQHRDAARQQLLNTSRRRRSSRRSTSPSGRRSRRSMSPSRNTVCTVQADRSNTWKT